MAEGIARSLAPAGVKISSAGSEPTQIRPEAVQVLEEIGIDPEGQHSKGMEAVGDGVDAVITLCAEEVCPAWLGQAWRVHWGLSDPAGVQGSGAERLQAFREVRDELANRLRALFHGKPSPRAR
jgi:arsenate reductase